jgi:hypothetical protein
MTHVRYLAFFTVLSLADYGLTWYLLGRTGGAAYEANPVANWWLQHFGWPGLALFKLTTVLLVSGLGVLIYRYRPSTARRLLTFACGLLAAVVLYSGYLVYAAEGIPVALESDEELLARQRHLDAETCRSNAYSLVLERVATDVVARRCTLRQAVAELSRAEKARDPAWLAVLGRQFNARTAEENLAVSVIENALALVNRNPSQMMRLARCLEEDFQASFGAPPPPAETSWRYRTSAGGPEASGAAPDVQPADRPRTM